MSVTISKRVGKGRPEPMKDPDVDKVAGLLEQISNSNGGSNEVYAR